MHIVQPLEMIRLESALSAYHIRTCGMDWQFTRASSLIPLAYTEMEWEIAKEGKYPKRDEVEYLCKLFRSYVSRTQQLGDTMAKSETNPKRKSSVENTVYCLGTWHDQAQALAEDFVPS